MSTVRVVLVWLGLYWLPAVQAADFTIKEVQVEKHQGAHQLSARIDYQLSDTALEALNNGVPLTFEVRVKLEKVWRSFWQERLFEARLRYQIRHHALTGLFRVVDLQTGEDQHFVTREAAMYALGELRNLRLVPLSELMPGIKYHVRLRADLDIESLPLPLRPLAYLGKGWKLTSGWTQWPLKL